MRPALWCLSSPQLPGWTVKAHQYIKHKKLSCSQAFAASVCELLLRVVAFAWLTHTHVVYAHIDASVSFRRGIRAPAVVVRPDGTPGGTGSRSCGRTWVLARPLPAVQTSALWLTALHAPNRARPRVSASPCQGAPGAAARTCLGWERPPPQPSSSGGWTSPDGGFALRGSGLSGCSPQLWGKTSETLLFPHWKPSAVV